jgi:hypothetical protein
MQLGHVMGFVLLLPPVEPPKVGYASDTGEFRGSVDQVSGRMIFDAQRPAHVEVSLSFNRQPRGDKQPREAPRVASVTLAAHEFRPLPPAHAAGGEGIMVGTLKLDGVERAVRIPISFTIDGPMLQGRGRVGINPADFDATSPRRRLDSPDDFALEVYLIASTP